MLTDREVFASYAKLNYLRADRDSGVSSSSVAQRYRCRGEGNSARIFCCAIPFLSTFLRGGRLGCYRFVTSPLL